MTRIGLFKRLGAPIKMGKGTVKTGDIIKADFDAIMNQKEGGWLYIKQPANIEQRELKPNRVLPGAKQVTRTPEPTVISTTNSEDEAIKEVTSIYERIENARKAEEDKGKASVEVNIDKLKEMKKLTNKEWFSVTKDQSIKLLTEAHIDFSHVPKTKWDLVRFIKGIIKDL